MKIGDLVRYPDGDIGVVVETSRIDWETSEECYYIKWGDGTEGEHLESELEVIA